MFWSGPSPRSVSWTMFCPSYRSCYGDDGNPLTLCWISFLFVNVNVRIWTQGRVERKCYFYVFNKVKIRVIMKSLARRTSLTIERNMSSMFFCRCSFKTLEKLIYLRFLRGLQSTWKSWRNVSLLLIVGVHVEHELIIVWKPSCLVSKGLTIFFR